MSAFLKGLSGEYAGRRVAMQQHHISIGRGQGSQILLHSTAISRNHAVVLYSNGVYAVRDEGSRAGTKVNGVRVTSSQLRDGDVIDVGGNTFRFHLDAAPMPTPHAAAYPSNDLDQAAARTVARSKSYVGDAFIILALYYVGLWLGGFIFNVIRLSEVNRIKRDSGIEPEGTGCLWALLIFHLVVPTIVLVAALATGGVILNWIGLNIVF